MNDRLDKLLTNERAERRHAVLDKLRAMQRRIDATDNLSNDLLAMLAEVNIVVWEILHDRTLH